MRGTPAHLPQHVRRAGRSAGIGRMRPPAARLSRYGKITLREHYERIAVEGQEYDPYTSVFGSKDTNADFKATQTKA